MRRRILPLVAAVLLLAAGAWGRASAQCGAQVPPDRITLEELRKALADKNPPLILDVRAGAETKIKGAKHIPLEELESRLSELPRDREIVTYCT